MSKVMQPGSFYDAEYFGHSPSDDPKSNYARLYSIGGYVTSMAAPDEFAEWVLINLKVYDPSLKVVPPAPGMGIVGKAPKVLEIGCATGAAVQAMRNRGIRAYGCDISEYILSQALGDVKNFLTLADMTDLEHSKITQWSPFDAVVSKDVLEHATEDKVDDILLDFARYAPVQFHMVNTGEYPHQAWDGDKTHNIRLTLAEWEAKAQALGLTVVFKST